MDLKTISELINMLENSKLSTMEIEYKDLKIKLGKENSSFPISIPSNYVPAVQSAPLKAETPAVQTTETVEEKAPAAEEGRIIKAPMVGTFYASASPDSEPYVSLGKAVKKGSTLCIIEAMKLMNEIESEEDCVIIEVLVKNGDLVEYGQPLFRIK